MLKLINKMKNKKGFTLIELIIVIAVLGIILAIAVPRFGEVQKKAKEDADTATGGMVGKAAELYYVAEKINGATTVTITDLVDDKYLAKAPVLQSTTSAIEAVSLDDKGNATVTTSPAGVQLYP